MSTKIQIKRSTTANTVPSGLSVGELAVNLTDKILYVGNTSGGSLILASAVSGGGSSNNDYGLVTDTVVASFDYGTAP